MKLTIHRYIFHEIWPPLMASLMVFVFIVLATRIINLAEWVVNHGVRLSQMLPPVVVVSSFCFAAALVISLVGAPWGHRSFKDLVFLVAHSKADLGIQERVFSEAFSGFPFYVNSFSEKDRMMQDVFLVDRRDPSASHTIVAKEGRIVSQPESRSIALLFVDGTIFISAKKTADIRTIVFDTYDMTIRPDDIMPALSGRDLSPKEMSYQDLRRSLESRKVSRNAQRSHGALFHPLRRLPPGRVCMASEAGGQRAHHQSLAAVFSCPGSMNFRTGKRPTSLWRV